MADARFRKWTRGQLPRRPELGSFVTGLDLSIQADGLQLTPARLGAILREAEEGNIASQSDLFTRLETDGHILAVMTARREAICERTFQLTAWDETSPAQRALELCEEQTAEVLEEVLFDLTDACGKAFSIAQNLWDIEAGRVVLRKVEWWPQQRFCLEPANLEAFRVLTAAQPSDGEPLAPGQWTVHRRKARSAVLPTAPLFRALAWPYLFKHYGVRDWVIAAEAYGTPRRYGKYPRGADDKEIAAIERAVMDLGTDGAATYPADAEIGFIESQVGRGAHPSPALVKFLDDQISKAVLGQTLTTEVSSSGGNRALGEVHERVKQHITNADCRALARTIRRDILTPIVRFNLGESAPVPRCRFVLEVEDDLEARGNVDRMLVKELGLRLGEQYFYETYGRPRPEKGEPALGGAAPAADAGGQK